MIQLERQARALGLRLGRVTGGDVTWAYLSLGPADGPLALCLHGFPDSAWTWRHLLPELAAAGWRAVAPWLRGYWPTVAPVASRVTPQQLATDVVTLHTLLGGDDRAVVVGHDWGAIATHGVTGDASPFARAVTMAVPPPAGLPLDRPHEDVKQAVLSAYVGLLALPGGPAVLRPRDSAFAAALWRRWSPGHVPDALDVTGWRTAIARDGGRTAAAYYRGLVTDLVAGRWPQPDRVPAIPLLHLAGTDDQCMHIGQIDRTAAILPDGSRAVPVTGAGHFLHLERPAHVNRLVLDHIGAAPPG